MKGNLMEYREWRLKLNELQLKMEAFDEGFEFDGTDETYKRYTDERKPLEAEIEAHYQKEGGTT